MNPIQNEDEQRYYQLAAAGQPMFTRPMPPAVCIGAAVGAAIEARARHVPNEAIEAAASLLEAVNCHTENRAMLRVATASGYIGLYSNPESLEAAADEYPARKHAQEGDLHRRLVDLVWDAHRAQIDVADWLVVALKDAAELLPPKTKSLLDTCHASERRDLLRRLMNGTVGEDDDP